MQVGGPLNGLEMARVIGKDNNVGYWGIPWDLSVGTKGSVEFGKRYQAKYNKLATWRDYLGYISMQQLLFAIQRAKDPDPRKVVLALEGHKFDGLKASPSYWRDWDHQNVQDTYCGRAKSGAEVKAPDDLFEIVSTTKGDAVANAKNEPPPTKLEAI
jgi:branched-chain amino acid transport system substrate-binding protein